MDTRLFERIVHGCFWVAIAALVVPLVLLLVGMAVVNRDQALLLLGSAVGIGCSTLGAVGVMSALLTLVFRGGAMGWLEEIAAELPGEVRGPNLLWFLRSPHLQGEVDGLPYLVMVKRIGGILSPSRPGGVRLLWGWLLLVRVEVPVGCRLALGRPGSPDAAVMLVTGLERPGREREGFHAWTDGSPRAAALLETPQVAALGRLAARMGQWRPVALKVGPDRVDWHGTAPPGTEPEHVVALVRAAAALRRA